MKRISTFLTAILLVTSCSQGDGDDGGIEKLFKLDGSPFANTSWTTKCHARFDGIDNGYAIETYDFGDSSKFKWVFKMYSNSSCTSLKYDIRGGRSYKIERKDPDSQLFDFDLNYDSFTWKFSSFYTQEKWEAQCSTFKSSGSFRNYLKVTGYQCQLNKGVQVSFATTQLGTIFQGETKSFFTDVFSTPRQSDNRRLVDTSKMPPFFKVDLK